jgi:hypothetical protein
VRKELNLLVACGQFVLSAITRLPASLEAFLVLQVPKHSSRLFEYSVNRGGARGVQQAELNGDVDSEDNHGGSSMDSMYYIRLGVQRKTISIALRVRAVMGSRVTINDPDHVIGMKQRPLI